MNVKKFLKVKLLWFFLHTSDLLKIFLTTPMSAYTMKTNSQTNTDSCVCAYLIIISINTNNNMRIYKTKNNNNQLI